VTAKQNKFSPPKQKKMPVQIHEAWLTKEGSGFKSWQRRKFAVYDNGELAYFDDKNNKKGSFNVRNRLVQSSEARPKPHLLRIEKDANKNALYLCADSHADKINFARALVKVGANWTSEKGTVPSSIGFFVHCAARFLTGLFICLC